MNRLLVIVLLLLSGLLMPSCISFPRAQQQARMRSQEQQRSEGRFVADPLPSVGTRKEFKDHYFRAQ